MVSLPKFAPRLIFLVGPTAIGKTAIAVYLAKKINAEIISCDSMQIYKGMGIIASKPAPRLLKAVKHHLLAIINVDKEYNVAKYRKAALVKLKEIIKKGKTPLVVGGTGLYISTLIDGIFTSKARNKFIRKRLVREAESLGSKALYKKLEEVDPQAASKIHPNDTKRIIRALEVFESTGKPISMLQQQRKGLSADYEVLIYCLNMERDKLYQRINARVDKMFRQGLLDEVRRLLKKRLSKTSCYAIGLNEIRSYIEGKCSLDQAKELMKKNTRNYAKRQLTWFRKDKRIHWIHVTENNSSKDIAKIIWKELY